MAKEKEYVLVSQGIEIYRSTNKEETVKMMAKYNEEWYKYCQECYDRGKKPADNEVFIYEE